MLDRWGWFAAAVLAAALAGCGGSGEVQDDESRPPSENGAGEGGGEAAPPTEGEGAGGGESAGGGEAPPPDMSGTGGGEVAPREGEAPPAPAGGESTPQPAGAGQPAASSGVIALEATWQGEGAGRKAVVRSGADEVAQLDPAAPTVSDPVVGYLKSKRDAMVAAGQSAKVTISIPLEKGAFDQVGAPLMKSAFRAGFKTGEVEFKTPGK